MLLPENKEPIEIFTWFKLKEFCNSLTDEQLEQEVIVPQDESSITIRYASSLGEDQYQFDELEYTCTKEDYDAENFDGLTFEESLETESYVLIPGTNVYLFDE